MSEVKIARGRMPADAQRVTLPWSEVCIHMRIAGQQRWVAKVAKDAAAIYDEDGHPYGAQVLLREAALDQDGRPMPLQEPSGIAVEVPDSQEPQKQMRVVIPDPPDGQPCVQVVREQPTVKLTVAQLLALAAASRPLAPGDPSLPVARLLIPLADVGESGRVQLDLAEAARLSVALAAAGWCCVLSLDGGVFELVARRRIYASAEALQELTRLGARGTLYLNDAMETTTLAVTELLDPAGEESAAEAR